MTPKDLVLRAVTYYWRTNLAVVLGVATAVAVLAGALLVGDSVRGSLRDLVFQRLGATDHVVVSTGFFPENLAERLRARPDFSSRFVDIAPIVMAQGFVTLQSGNRQSTPAAIYGVDNRFWRFHTVTGTEGPGDREALVSPALGKELGADAGATILVRLQRPTDIPIESLFGQKENLGRTVRLTIRAVVSSASVGEFSLQPRQGDVRAVFVPLARLQQELDVDGRVNVLLVASKSPAEEGATNALKEAVRSEARLEDLGLRLRPLPLRRALSLESDAGVLTEAQARAAVEAAGETHLQGRPVLTYLANAIRSGGREIPYSLVTAIDLDSNESSAKVKTVGGVQDRPPIVLNTWAAENLKVGPGDPVTVEYYLWEESGRLLTRTAEFSVSRIVAVDRADSDLAPVYPGISDSPTLEGWDPPFPIDLRRVRKIDEDYWQTYRTTPKAFIPLAVGQTLWKSRYGSMTSIRLATDAGNASDQEVLQRYEQALRARVDPLSLGLTVQNVRAEGLDASRGATDFGEYFVYFSFFLVVSALLLAALFFKLSVEQRVREVGLLRSVGFRPQIVRRLFLKEGFLLSVLGSAIGVIGAVAYAFLIMAALRTWWVDAVGTTALTLHVSPLSLVLGAAGGIVAALACIWTTLRLLSKVSDRSLLAGQLTPEPLHMTRRRRSQPFLIAATTLGIAGLALVAGAASGMVGRTGAFFGAGAAGLGACLCFLAFWLRRPVGQVLKGHGWIPVTRLGARNVTYRPGRSVLAVAVVAAATFILISVDAFRRDNRISTTDRHSGIGGYTLQVETLIPIVHDPNDPEGRRILGLTDLDSVMLEPFRLLPGEDASCLNLYEPKNPRILAPRDSFLAQGRFTFQSSLATSEAERANPWLLLKRDESDGAVPVIADANSMTYVLHRQLGDDFVLTRGDRTIRLRLVAALEDSVFQGELLMSQANFLRLFPDYQGYQFALVETPPDQADQIESSLENALVDFGADAKSTAARVAEFHRVENTYLSTFQTLGGLGLLLGTLGLGAVLMRNVLERRRELALLQALGYRRIHVLAMVLAENVWLLVAGLVTGTLCALIAIAPVIVERGGRLPVVSLILLLGSVLVVGLTASVGATTTALRSPLLPALRAE
jgi:ABC-type lipoprotein release transport system permease subunit